jgi:hypothetical protein
MNDRHHTFSLRIERVDLDERLFRELLAVGIVTLSQIRDEAKKSTFGLVAELKIAIRNFLNPLCLIHPLNH